MFALHFFVARVYGNCFCKAESYCYAQGCTLKLQFERTKAHLYLNTAINTFEVIHAVHIRIVFVRNLVR